MTKAKIERNNMMIAMMPLIRLQKIELRAAFSKMDVMIGCGIMRLYKQ